MLCSSGRAPKEVSTPSTGETVWTRAAELGHRHLLPRLLKPIEEVSGNTVINLPTCFCDCIRTESERDERRTLNSFVPEKLKVRTFLEVSSS